MTLIYDLDTMFYGCDTCTSRRNVMACCIYILYLKTIISHVKNIILRSLAAAFAMSTIAYIPSVDNIGFTSKMATLLR